VNGTSSAPWESPAGRPWLMLALLAFGSLGTVAATVLGNGNFVIAFAPLLFATAAALVWFLPLRFPLFVLIFLGLAVDSTEGPWLSPLTPLGQVLHVNLATAIPGSGIPLPGVALLLLALLLIHVHRRIAGIRTDARTVAPPAAIGIQAMGVSVLTILAICLLGLKGGGDLKMAKIQVQVYIMALLFGYLASITMRGVKDYRIIGRIVVAAACIKALIALYVAYVVVVPGAEFATSHGDSLLFAGATALLLIRFAEQPIKQNLVICLFLVPLLAAGMVANDRRLVWVELLVPLIAYWLVSRRSQIKRYFVRGLLLALPLIVAYVGAGWNSTSGAFAPVRTLRSVGDSDVDSSTMYRDLENYNLLMTLRLNMLTGAGFGQPFAEVVTLPNISFFQEYRYLPHNSVLGLWAFCGPLGFTGLTAAMVVAIYLAARSYPRVTTPDERTAAAMVMAMVLIYMVHCWGDIGFTERRSMYLIGPVLAIAAQLGVSSGAWRIRTVRPRSSATHS
jgi:hypothetical protein